MRFKQTSKQQHKQILNKPINNTIHMVKFDTRNTVSNRLSSFPDLHLSFMAFAWLAASTPGLRQPQGRFLCVDSRGHVEHILGTRAPCNGQRLLNNHAPIIFCVCSCGMGSRTAVSLSTGRIEAIGCLDQRDPRPEFYIFRISCERICEQKYMSRCKTRPLNSVCVVTE